MAGNQLQLMKTRSSSGVGQKIDLEFDVESLRIHDLGEDPRVSNSLKNKVVVSMTQLKNKSNDTGVINATRRRYWKNNCKCTK